ncbi:MAG: hypothetical protein JW828_01420, partial [Sedimentisphaerales bacterium]|nr:hypothetical protein [Sedimentisphaerales bacterium]
MNEEPKHPPCRLHAMVAAQADTAVVFRRGPSRWWHVLQWDLKTYELQSGAWVKGILYPRRSAISPDGELLCYFILKGFYPGDEDNKWDAYFAVSKMPWVTALTAWWAGSTWVTGCWFERDNELTISGLPTGLGEPFHGSFPYKVNQIPIWMEWDKARFLQEFKSGWRFIEDEWIRENQEYLQSKLPTDKQAWPQPPMGLMKYRPGDMAMLVLLDWGAESGEKEVQGTHAIEFCMPE